MITIDYRICTIFMKPKNTLALQYIVNNIVPIHSRPCEKARVGKGRPGVPLGVARVHVTQAR